MVDPATGTGRIVVEFKVPLVVKLPVAPRHTIPPSSIRIAFISSRVIWGPSGSFCRRVFSAKARAATALSSLRIGGAVE